MMEGSPGITALNFKQFLHEVRSVINGELFEGLRLVAPALGITSSNGRVNERVENCISR